MRAAWCESTTVGTLADAYRNPRHASKLTTLPVIGDRGDEATRVRVPRPGENDVRGPFLDDPPRVQHRDPVRDLRDHCEVVRDVDHRELPLAAQPLDLVQHARLRDDVEPGRRLVEHDDRRFADECQRDRHALLLPAGELVRVPTAELRRRGKMHALQRPFDASVRRTAVDVLVEHVLDRGADAQGRVQGAAGILWDV